MPTSPRAHASPGPGDLATDASGGLRAGWDRVLGTLADLGPDELARRRRAADRLMRAEGAGVVLHEDADHAVRPWGIDIVPLVVDGDAWAGIAAGLAERAEMLAAALADLHGSRHLLRAGVVPVEAVAGHATTSWSSWHDGPGRRLVVVGAALDRHLPLGTAPGRDGTGAVASLVVAVRGPLLSVGEIMPSGWLGERPRRLR